MIEETVNKIYEAKQKLEEAKKEIDKALNWIDKQANIISRALLLELDAFKSFLKKPYALISKSQYEWWCIVPKLANFSVGWLDHSDESYNYYVINKYTQWIGDLPEEIRKAIQFKESEKIKVVDSLMEFEKGQESLMRKRYGKYLKEIKEGYARIKRGKEFDLIAEIIDNGSLPFTPQPVSEDDLKEAKVNFNFEGKYNFQEDAFETFLRYGAIGVYWMTGAGKSFFAMYCLSRIKGDKAIIVPTKTLIEQWKNYLREYAPSLLNEVEIYTYNSYNKIKNKEFSLIVFDECQRLPATTFSRLATLKTKYRIGLSATPYREDGKTNYIFALTGFPIGLDWQTILKILGKHYHEVNVHLVTNETAKINKVKELLQEDTKTIIFCDSIKLGSKIAKRLDVPFIYGATKDRMEIAKTEPVIVASRVMDLGISIKDLKHIIEVDFLYGSRQQEVQRTGRLFHSETAGRKHDIIMTDAEYNLYQKRLYGLMEKGFKINLVK